MQLRREIKADNKYVKLKAGRKECPIENIKQIEYVEVKYIQNN